MIVIFFMLSILFGAVGALLMKIGAARMGTVHLNSVQTSMDFLVKTFTSPTVLGGMFLYFISAALWLYLLTKLDISIVQPILALTYVATPILAIVFIGERVPLMRWLGVSIIILGVYIVARTAGAVG